jgi:hypothetical protein
MKNTDEPLVLPDQLDQDFASHGDPLGRLLDQSSCTKASPTFLQNTLRQNRLEQDHRRASFKTLFLTGYRSLSFACIGALMVIAAFILSTPKNLVTDASSPAEITSSQKTSSEWIDLEEALVAEVLSDAAKDPTLLSDQEIVTLLY